MHTQTHLFYHHGKDNSSLRGLDDPEQDQAAELDDGEEVHLPQGDMAQVDEVWLMFGWHAEQPQTVEQLHRYRQTVKNSLHIFPRLVPLIKFQQVLRGLTWIPLSEEAPMYRKTPYSTGIGINWRQTAHLGSDKV